MRRPRKAEETGKCWTLQAGLTPCSARTLNVGLATLVEAEQTTGRHFARELRGDVRPGNSTKMINSTSMIARQALRRFTTSAVRRGGHHDPYDGVPGHNFPFSTKNRHVLLAMFMVYLGSGFSIPFLMVRHQLKK